nr:ABC transporter permease subunit [Paenibacillus cymbidii]
MLLIPGLAYFIVYRYVPMLGNIIAFQDFSPYQGFLKSDWVGWKHFARIFDDTEVLRVIRNTLWLSFLQIIFAFPVPVVLSIMMNELRSDRFKRITQSIVYLPYFLSWVVVIGIATVFLRSDGVINHITEWMGREPIVFLQEPSLFMPIIVIEVIWKESGWGTIIFLAALAGVNPSLYEAAVVDGAGRWRRIWHVTLPAIRGTVVILLILRLGNVLDSGFEQIFLMLNPFVMKAGDVLDTYVYFKGIQQADFSFGTAVGLFKGAVGLVLIVGANRLAKRFGEQGIY